MCYSLKQILAQNKLKHAETQFETFCFSVIWLRLKMDGALQILTITRVLNMFIEIR